MHAKYKDSVTTCVLIGKKFNSDLCLHFNYFSYSEIHMAFQTLLCCFSIELSSQNSRPSQRHCSTNMISQSLCPIHAGVLTDLQLPHRGFDQVTRPVNAMATTAFYPWPAQYQSSWLWSRNNTTGFGMPYTSFSN